MVMIVKAGVPKLKPSLKDVFQRVDAQSCPFLYNFHLHTVCSDGQLQPEDLIQQAIQHGLSDLAITDHHTVNGYNAAREYLGNRPEQPTTQQAPLPRLWSGVEITATLLAVEVHILGYGFELDHPSLQPYLQGYSLSGKACQANRVISALHDAGGLTVLAHPARYKRPFTELIPAAVHAGIDGVETYYGYGNSDPWQPSPQQTAAVGELGNCYGLLHSCGTDTHGSDIRKRL